MATNFLILHVLVMFYNKIRILKFPVPGRLSVISHTVPQNHHEAQALCEMHYYLTQLQSQSWVTVPIDRFVNPSDDHAIWRDNTG